MACGGCGSVRGMTKPEVANYIQELIDQQKLQAGINDCDGKALPKGAEVVLCDKLADIICDLINKEKVCFPTIDEFVYDADKETLSLTFGGKEYTTHIKVKGGDVTGEGKMVFILFTKTVKKSLRSTLACKTLRSKTVNLK